MAEIKKLFQKQSDMWGGWVDLTFSSECLSYLRNWKALLEIVSHYSKYLLISLYIPNNPIGFVKSETELVENVEKYFEILEVVSLRKTNFRVIFARSKNVV